MQDRSGKIARRGGSRTKMPKEAWRRRLRAAVERSGKSLRSISIAAGQDPSYVSELLRGKIAEPTIGPLQKICAEVGVTTPYILEGYELTPATQRIVKAFSAMTPEDQENWLAVIERAQPR
jgi:transcriptional regulator with XRE-family HTH domain